MMPAGDTKASAAARRARRPIVAKSEPRDDGPLLRAALNASYAMAYGSDGRPTEDPEKIRSRFAEFLGVDVASIGHSERRLPCSGCRGLRSVNVRERGFVRRRETCSTCKGEGIGAFEFVQLPDEARDGKATTPRQRLEFFMLAPDVTKLPKAPDHSRGRRRHALRRAAEMLRDAAMHPAIDAAIASTNDHVREEPLLDVFDEWTARTGATENK